MRARARLLALLVVASLLVSVSGFARVLYVCRMSGKVGPACCCSHERKHSGKAPEVRRADCCEVTAVKAREAALTSTQELPRLLPPALVAVLTDPVPPSLGSPVLGGTPARSRAPPLRASPVYLINCTLLV